jgi:hypothetical protein
MSLTIRRGGTRHTPRPTTESVPAHTQDEQRHRRRHWLRVHYTGDFNLTSEITDIVGPIAAQITYLPHPAALREHVEDVADAVHEVLSVVVGMLAESRHLEGEAHQRTLHAVRDLARRPREPQITDAQIIDGSWASLLVRHVSPYTADLAGFLARALAPRHRDLKGPSASERIEAALRVLDTAALSATRRIPKAAEHQARGTVAEANEAARHRRAAERAEAALSRYGNGVTR